MFSKWMSLVLLVLWIFVLMNKLEEGLMFGFMLVNFFFGMKLNINFFFNLFVEIGIYEVDGIEFVYLLGVVVGEEFYLFGYFICCLLYFIFY